MWPWGRGRKNPISAHQAHFVRTLFKKKKKSHITSILINDHIFSAVAFFDYNFYIRKNIFGFFGEVRPRGLELVFHIIFGDCLLPARFHCLPDLNLHPAISHIVIRHHDIVNMKRFCLAVTSIYETNFSQLSQYQICQLLHTIKELRCLRQYRHGDGSDQHGRQFEINLVR